MTGMILIFLLQTSLDVMVPAIFILVPVFVMLVAGAVIYRPLAAE